MAISIAGTISFMVEDPILSDRLRWGHVANCASKIFKRLVLVLSKFFARREVAAFFAQSQLSEVTRSVENSALFRTQPCLEFNSEPSSKDQVVSSCGASCGITFVNVSIDLSLIHI